LNTPTAHQALGYDEIGKFLNGNSTKEQLIERISTKTWQFARRQYTWFRHQHPESVIISDASEFSIN
jgi:tRNA dimethylallyltransferase